MAQNLNLMFPLDRFYQADGRPLPEISQVDGKDIPDPYRALLVGNHDMTPTLEAFHGGRIEIQTLERLHESTSNKSATDSIDRHPKPETRDPVSGGRYPIPESPYVASADIETLGRIVVLLLEGSAKPVEFGAIIIHLDLVPPEARERILECHVPFGTILATYCIEHISRPRAFIRLEPDEMMATALGLSEPVTLYGRRNVISNLHNEVLADIIEVLPP